jgi:hypothetical protein
MVKKPAILKHKLLIVSGLLWSFAGLMLLFISSKWFPAFSAKTAVLDISAGIMMGVIISRFGFMKLARKNANRILAYSKHVCAFAFQRWQMYPLILVMMSMGIFMRNSPFVPKYLLAPVYIGIGSALFAASFTYYKIFLLERRGQSEII